MIEFILDVFERSKHDPFFWISNIIIVAAMCYVVYNLWNNNRDTQ